MRALWLEKVGGPGAPRRAAGPVAWADRRCRTSTARLQSAALEGSNVSPAETMGAMIAAARQFEQQMKMIPSADQTEQSATKPLAP